MLRSATPKQPRLECLFRSETYIGTRSCNISAHPDILADDVSRPDRDVKITALTSDKENKKQKSRSTRDETGMSFLTDKWWAAPASPLPTCGRRYPSRVSPADECARNVCVRWIGPRHEDVVLPAAQLRKEVSAQRRRACVGHSRRMEGCFSSGAEPTSRVEFSWDVALHPSPGPASRTRRGRTLRTGPPRGTGSPHTQNSSGNHAG